jgi:cytidine deaminase
MYEYESKQEQTIPVYFMGESGEVYKSNSISNLLPLSFDKKSL